MVEKVRDLKHTSAVDTKEITASRNAEGGISAVFAVRTSSLQGGPVQVSPTVDGETERRPSVGKAEAVEDGFLAGFAVNLENGSATLDVGDRAEATDGSGIALKRGSVPIAGRVTYYIYQGHRSVGNGALPQTAETIDGGDRSRPGILFEKSARTELSANRGGERQIASRVEQQPFAGTEGAGQNISRIREEGKHALGIEFETSACTRGAAEVSAAVDRPGRIYHQPFWLEGVGATVECSQDCYSLRFGSGSNYCGNQNRHRQHDQKSALPHKPCSPFN